MAKRENKAKDFIVPKMDFGNGFVLELQCRISGLMYLEDLFDKSISNIEFKTVKDTFHLLTALAISTYPDMDMDEIKRKVGQITATQINKVMDKSKDIFGVSAKNSQTSTKTKQLTETS